ncbi:MAG: methylamine methyltransferase corrinoid protein reductive activase [Methanomassiliicoccales archaeon]
MSIGLAVDVGTSGTRVQAIDLEKDKVISTAITLRHPLPGYNVIDHLHFALENGCDVAHRLVVDTVSLLISRLEIDTSDVVRVAACGNPIQMSIFHGIECRDLAFAGKNKLQRLGVERVTRNAAIVTAGAIGLAGVPSEADVCIPPAVEHEIGGDALAMVIKSNLMEQKGVAVVADFGTNAEMSIKVDDKIYTGSAAAGPAIEGQEIEMGSLASPRTISDVDISGGRAVCKVLSEEMFARESFDVDLSSGSYNRLPGYIEPKGITGTGTVALISEALRVGLIKPPQILTPNHEIQLFPGIRFTEADLIEAGHAFGAFRAGYLTLAAESGMAFEDIKTAYMCGASGFYVDALKAQRLWLTPTSVEHIYQVGNTSLAMAADIVKDPTWLDRMQDLAKDLRGTHIMFANSEAFKNAFILELAFWDEGYPIERYLKKLKDFGLPKIPEKPSNAVVTKLVVRDIPEFGPKGLKILEEIGVRLNASFDGCNGCEQCRDACLEGALVVMDEGSSYKVVVRSDLCDGVSCKRCESSCPDKVFDFSKLKVSSS